MIIREATGEESNTLARLISEANRDVAVRFGLNGENNPKHPSFCNRDWVEADFARGERYFLLEANGEPMGCVAYETPRVGVAYLNRLSVLPVHRQRGAGTRLVQHVIRQARTESVQTLSIGIIAEHLQLQRWYNGLGFQDGELKRFAHLPFSVRYMSYNLAGG